MKLALLAAMLAGAATAQTVSSPPPGPIAIERPETQGAGRLTVTSSAFADGATIPQRYSRYYDNVSPPLAWRGAPHTAKSYVVIVDDPDASLKPVNHWSIWNLTRTSLPEHVATDPQLVGPVTAIQGTTTMRHPGYAGPHPPVGDPPHHYHFQVFALDAPLAIAPAADREPLLAAMNGHVVARGELIGLSGQTAPTGK